MKTFQKVWKGIIIEPDARIDMNPHHQLVPGSFCGCGCCCYAGYFGCY
ncbi:MAG: hypothetical protein HXS46_20555 [Theionarchaea archaeon]|nr:hypothetical protein [Theionarchaea archaeon]